MTSTKGVLLSAIGKLVLRDGRVTELAELSPRVRRLTVEGAALRDVAWRAGDKLQVLLPTRDVRTYTPTTWDARRGATELVVFDHGDHPGASWSRRVGVGDPCRFVGPQRSIARTAGRAGVLFGDETSYAVACALARVVPAAPLACVLEVGDRADAELVIAALGLGDQAEVTLVTRVPGDAHLAEAGAAIERALRAGGELLLTGRAPSIQAIRTRRRAAGAGERGATKPYWAPGKTGLD